MKGNYVSCIYNLLIYSYIHCETMVGSDSESDDEFELEIINAAIKRVKSLEKERAEAKKASKPTPQKKRRPVPEEITIEMEEEEEQESAHEPEKPQRKPAAPEPARDPHLKKNNGSGYWNKCDYVKRGGEICGKRCIAEKCSAHKYVVKKVNEGYYRK